MNGQRPVDAVALTWLKVPPPRLVVRLSVTVPPKDVSTLPLASSAETWIPVAPPMALPAVVFPGWFVTTSCVAGLGLTVNGMVVAEATLGFVGLETWSA